MGEWWSAMSFEQQAYYGIAIVATLLVGLQTLALMVGGAADLADAGDFDMDDATEHPSGIQLLSSRTIVAFFVGFGWTGVVASGDGGSTLTAVAAVFVGLFFAGVILQLMRLLHRLRHSGSLDYRNAIGEVGTVYLPIPAAMEGVGRIQVMVQGRLKVIEALTRHAERIENRRRVRVVELLDENTLVVELANGPSNTEESS